LQHHIQQMIKSLLSGTMEELRLLKKELPMALKRAAEAFREDPSRNSLNSETFRKARMADDKVSSIRRRIAQIESAELEQKQPPA
jgi:hypothetical protein